MAATVYGIRNCDTVRKARAWLDSHGIDYVFHDFKVAGVERKQLEHWCTVLGWTTLLNRAGTTFRKLSAHDKAVSDADTAIALMLVQPSMIKRPVIEHAGILLVGFRPELYSRTLQPHAAAR